jgi:murein DD-endopeptidase MepM/ murein hydrolase activator NlpD
MKRKIILKQKALMLKAGAIVAITGAAASLWLLAASPAGARPDELLQRNAPYPAPAAVAAGPPAILEMYQIQAGDTLTGIARKKSVDVELLAAANGILERDRIRAGQVLKVPAGSTVHRVQPGETLWDISRTYRADLQSIIEKNGLINVDNILAGQKLLIPFNSKEVAARGTGYQKAARLLSWPLYGVITSPFGLREGRPHEGIDIAAEEGDPIRPATAGRVVFAGPRGTYGLAVIIDHGGGVRTLYAHCSELLVKEGDQVDEGRIIARAGNTGNSRGPHLHLEILREGVPQDPVLWLPAERYYG